MKELISLFDLWTIAYMILALGVAVAILWAIEHFTVGSNFHFDKFQCDDEAICTFSGHVVLIQSKCRDYDYLNLYNVLYKTNDGTLKTAKLPESKLVKIKSAKDKDFLSGNTKKSADDSDKTAGTDYDTNLQRNNCQWLHGLKP